MYQWKPCECANSLWFLLSEKRAAGIAEKLSSVVKKTSDIFGLSDEGLCLRSHVIHTGLQPGAGNLDRLLNRFNGFSFEQNLETVKTVPLI